MLLVLLPCLPNPPLYRKLISCRSFFSPPCPHSLQPLYLSWMLSDERCKQLFITLLFVLHLKKKKKKVYILKRGCMVQPAQPIAKVFSLLKKSHLQHLLRPWKALWSKWWWGSLCAYLANITRMKSLAPLQEKAGIWNRPLTRSRSTTQSLTTPSQSTT